MNPSISVKTQPSAAEISRKRATPSLKRQASMDTEGKPSPYRWRTAIRRYLPWFLIDLGIAGKGQDCESAGGSHSWYNVDDKSSGCYHCKVVRLGRLWESADV